MKIVFLSWWLPGLRSGLVFLECAVYYFIASVVFPGVSFEKGMPPLTDWRMPIVRRQTYIGSRLAMRISGFRIKVVGKPSRPRKAWNPPIISNHISYADVPILATQGHTGFVAKAGIGQVPVLRSIGHLWHVVFLHRRDQGSREAIQKTLRDRCEDLTLPSPTVFVEGSTTNGRWLMQFRPGVFRLAKPVQPVLLHYPHKHASAAWDTCSFSYSVLRALSQIVIPAELHYLPVYIPNEAEEADAVLYADNVRRAMAEYAAEHGLNIRLTEANVMEKLVYQDYCDGKITWGAVLADMRHLYDKMGDAVPAERREGLERMEAMTFGPAREGYNVLPAEENV